MNQDMLDRLNAQMRSIRKDLKSRSVLKEDLFRPGDAFFISRCGEIGKEADLLLILKKDEENPVFLCCKMSIETSFAAEYDLILQPKEWTGAYSVMAEAWNTILLPVESIADIKDEIDPAKLDQIIHLHEAFHNGLPPARHLSEYCGSPLLPDDNRRDFQQAEREKIEQIREQNQIHKPGEGGFSAVKKSKRLRAMNINHIYRIDNRAGFEMPYRMTRHIRSGHIVPVEELSLSSGEWDLIQIKGANIKSGCFVSSGIFGRLWIEQKELESIQWREINREIHRILGYSEGEKKIRGLEKLFAESKEDPYVAFNLGWILLFEGLSRDAMDYLTFAEENFPYPEFKNLAAKAKAILLQKDAPALQKPDDVFHQVWRIRILQSDAAGRIAMMKALWLRTNSGYVAYELAREYKYLGAFSETVDYRHYCTILKWALNALNAKEPIDSEMIKWVEDIRKRIAPPISRIEDGDCRDVSRVYVPLRGAA